MRTIAKSNLFSFFVAAPLALVGGMSACKKASPSSKGETAEPAHDPAGSQAELAKNAEKSPGHQPAVKAPQDGCSLPMRSMRFESKGRVVAIGDVHGDFQATLRALRTASLIDESENWAGGTTHLVQTGDVLDRGNDEPEIMALFAKLALQAQKAGGQVHQLNGNHELMNAMGDFRYVTEEGVLDFGKGETDLELAFKERVRAFSPGGEYAKQLAAFDLVRIVDDSVFVHGGVLPDFAASLETENREARCFLLGESEEPPASVVDPNGPLWTRAFSTGSEDCALLDKTLETLQVKRMVVGHTPQLEGITSACDGKVWRIDTGAASYYGGPAQSLEISESGVQILR